MRERGLKREDMNMRYENRSMRSGGDCWGKANPCVSVENGRKMVVLLLREKHDNRFVVTTL